MQEELDKCGRYKTTGKCCFSNKSHWPQTTRREYKSQEAKGLPIGLKLARNLSTRYKLYK